MARHLRGGAAVPAVLPLLLLLLLAPQAASQDASPQLAHHIVANTPAGNIRAALDAFVAFSESHGLGMHLGKEKSDLIEVSVGHGLPESGPAVVFEMGCHAGDGTLSAMGALKERQGSTVISTEENKKWLEATKRVVGHATTGMDIKFLPFSFGADEDLDLLLDTLQTKHGITHFDSVIFDHDEHLFLTHLKIVVGRGFLRPGSTVYVDNVKRKGKQLRKYMEFVNTKARKGFETEIRHIRKPYPDAVAISTWWGASEL